MLIRPLSFRTPLREDPEVTPPIAVMPSPNAYNFYLQAGNARVSAAQIDAVKPKPMAPETPEEEKASEIMQEEKLSLLLPRRYLHKLPRASLSRATVSATSLPSHRKDL